MSSLRFPKEAHVRRERDFHALRVRGRRLHGREAVVKVLATDGPARLGLAAPRAYGTAVRRNRFRRLAREAFRAVASELGSCDLLVMPRRGLREPSLEGLRADLLAAAQQARR